MPGEHFRLVEGEQWVQSHRNLRRQSCYHSAEAIMPERRGKNTGVRKKNAPRDKARVSSSGRRKLPVVGDRRESLMCPAVIDFCKGKLLFGALSHQGFTSQTKVAPSKKGNGIST